MYVDGSPAQLVDEHGLPGLPSTHLAAMAKSDSRQPNCCRVDLQPAVWSPELSPEQHRLLPALAVLRTTKDVNAKCELKWNSAG